MKSVLEGRFKKLGKLYNKLWFPCVVLCIIRPLFLDVVCDMKLYVKNDGTLINGNQSVVTKTGLFLI